MVNHIPGFCLNESWPRAASLLSSAEVALHLRGRAIMRFESRLQTAKAGAAF